MPEVDGPLGGGREGVSTARTMGPTPEDDLALAGLQFRAAELDEHDTMWDDRVHPKSPDVREEAVTDREGTRLVDVQRDTPRVDDAATFDLTMGDLTDVDL